MATKRLTDTGIANLNPPEEGRVEIWDTIVPGLGVRVGKRRKMFVVMIRLSGRVRRLTIGAFPGLGVSEARARAREIIEQAQNGIDVVARGRAVAAHEAKVRENTVASTIKQYIDKYAKRRQRSWLQTKQVLQKYLVKPYGERALSDLTRTDILRVLDDIEAQGYTTAANRTLALAKTYFRWCIERGLIDQSPAAHIRPPSKEVSRDRVLTETELRRVWVAAVDAGYPYGDIVRLLMLTAQRRNEVASMRWDELDLESRVWTISASRNKSARLHAVPLSPTVVEVLCGFERVGPLVFPASNELAGENGFSGWSRAKRRLDLASNVKEWRLHDLRPTAATGMARAGFPPYVVERVLNHTTSSAGPLASVYQRYEYGKEKTAALLNWDREVLSIVNNRVTAIDWSTAAE